MNLLNKLPNSVKKGIVIASVPFVIGMQGCTSALAKNPVIKIVYENFVPGIAQPGWYKDGKRKNERKRKLLENQTNRQQIPEHVVIKSDGLWYPESGYGWVNKEPAKNQDYRVKKVEKIDNLFHKRNKLTYELINLDKGKKEIEIVGLDNYLAYGIDKSLDNNFPKKGYLVLRKSSNGKIIFRERINEDYCKNMGNHFCIRSDKSREEGGMSFTHMRLWKKDNTIKR
tara:strand:- start:539 stop:1219 length:681 start_codon:yes stop_codon:yes gene_type:complete